MRTMFTLVVMKEASISTECCVEVADVDGPECWVGCGGTELIVRGPRHGALKLMDGEVAIVIEEPSEAHRGGAVPTVGAVVPRRIIIGWRKNLVPQDLCDRLAVEEERSGAANTSAVWSRPVTGYYRGDTWLIAEDSRLPIHILLQTVRQHIKTCETDPEACERICGDRAGTGHATGCPYRAA